MDAVKCFDGLQLYQDTPFNQEVGDILTDDHPVVIHLDRLLLGNYKSGLTQFMRESILIDLLEEP